MNDVQQHRIDLGKSTAQFRVFQDEDALSQAAAEHIAEVAEESVSVRGRFLLVLTGGSTPKKTYERLAADQRSRIPWEHVHLFWGDERYVPEDHEESNQRAARDAFIDEVPIPPEQVYPIPTHHADPQKAAEAYDALVREVLSSNDTKEAPLFDLVLMGMGDDRHIASLFPGRFDPAEAEQSTLEAPWVRAVKAPSHQPIEDRVTLTFPALNHTRRMAFLVAGEKKHTALRSLVDESPPPEQAPARLIQPEEELIWFVDREAWGEPETVDRQAES